MKNTIKSIAFSLSLLAIPQYGFCTLVAEKKALTSIIKKIQEEEHLTKMDTCGIDSANGKCLLSFKAEEEAQLPKARKLIVEVVEKFREQGNEKWELSSRMEGGYVDTKNIDASIEFPHESQTSISRVTHQNGTIRYTFDDGHEQEENYTEALMSVYPIPLDLARKLIANTNKKR